MDASGSAHRQQKRADRHLGPLAVVQLCGLTLVQPHFSGLHSPHSVNFAAHVMSTAKLEGGTMKRLWVTLLLGTSWMLSGPAYAQSVSPQESSSHTISNQDLDLLRKDLRAKRKQLIAANLRLTEDEAKRFWPVYDQYIKELVVINDKKFALIQNYADNLGKMTDFESLLFIRNWLDSDIATTQLRQRYVPIVAKVLDGKKTATFFQLDRRIAMMLELQVSSQMPLVQDQ